MGSALPLAYFVALGKSLGLSAVPFLHLRKGRVGQEQCYLTRAAGQSPWGVFNHTGSHRFLINLLSGEGGLAWVAFKVP